MTSDSELDFISGGFRRRSQNYKKISGLDIALGNKY